MIEEIVLASRNKGKIAEIAALLPEVRLLSLEDIGFRDEIAEPFDTFRENALQKARTVQEFCGRNVLSDDSGIVVPALGGAPGVFSARYAGPGATDADNNRKLLRDLEGVEDRQAHYYAVLCLILGDEVYFFEDRCEGKILQAPKGTGGFGYDPLFVPEGYEDSFAELPAAVKGQLSHRGKALKKMEEFFREAP